MKHNLGTVAIVGATGAVGREAITILESRGHHADRIVPLASARSAGSEIHYTNGTLLVRAIDDGAFDGTDFAVFCANADVSRQWAQTAQRSGTVVIDNSSAFRLREGVPLVIPEVNAPSIEDGVSLIANPNCSTIILLVALNPLRVRFGVERIVVSTYQAVSGAGAAALIELREQAAAVLNGRPVSPRVFREPCAFNVFSHNSRVEPSDGLNGEERKMIDESRKIWNDPHLEIVPTCVRVPVFRAHTESVTVTLRTPAAEAEVREALAHATGIRVLDDRENNLFPTTLGATGLNEVLVGRIRPDPTEKSSVADSTARGGRTPTFRTWSLLIVGDQVRKGAALNAIQIAEIIAGRCAKQRKVTLS